MDHVTPPVSMLAPGLLIMAAAAAAACTKPEAVTSPPAGAGSTMLLPAGLTPAASLLDLMAFPIDQYANDVWGAVSSVSTAEGMKDIAPATDQEWTLLRQKALLLAEAASLLVVEGRPVAHPGQKLRAESGPGDFTPAQAQVQIGDNPEAFAAFSAALQGAASQVVAAIEARNVDQLFEAGNTLQQACEQCHERFWHPNTREQPAP